MTERHHRDLPLPLVRRAGAGPWLDNLTRPYLRDGTPAHLVGDGIRGVTANPTIFTRAIQGSDAYDDQFADLIGQGRPVIDAYWDLVIDDVIHAYLSGLETIAAGVDLRSVHSVASFFLSRVDTEVDRRLESIGIDRALARRGQAAVAQARVAYEVFTQQFSGERWERLTAAGARVQRPLWASTSTKNDTCPDTLYVDSLIGPDTVNTLPEPTIAAFDDHGVVARTVDTDVEGAHRVLSELEAVGVDMEAVGRALEDQGVTSFLGSVSDLLDGLEAKARTLPGR